MAEDKLGIRERSLLLALMAEAREISNPDLKKRLGFALDGAPRKKLNELKLVTSRREGGGPFFHALTENGWAWCSKELSGECPPRSGSAGGALYAVLAGLNRYLDRTDLKLADIFGSGAAKKTTPVAPSASNLETRIRTAYSSLAKEPRDWVRLAQLRQRLGDVPKAEVDAALRRMSDAKSIRLTLEENQKTLTKEDRAASIRLGPNDMHLMAIEE